MSVFDILLGAALIFAAYRGFREGTVVQVCGLVSLVISVFLASHYGRTVGEWLHMSRVWGNVTGFILILTASMLIIALGAKVVKRIFTLAGFGPIDSIMGAVLGTLKMALMLGVVLMLFDTLNGATHWVSDDTRNKSALYGPIGSLSDTILPYLHRAFMQTVL